MAKQRDLLIQIAKSKGIFRTRDVVSEGISKSMLPRLVASGEIEQIGRGTYRYCDLSLTENNGLAVASLRVDSSIICLLSALSFHQMTTQLPSSVWVGIESGRVAPRVEYPPIEVTFMAKDALDYGLEEHVIEKVPVKITNPPKTVADCFKYRSKVGLDVALEALRDYWHQRRGTVSELLQAADVCRVAKVIRPYLEATIG